ncbi:MAG: hypothetical protein IJJ38_04550 [Lachnospiraceae bacterium]|nr:hypothetical protein [Lachnospiraceae bacterium]
MIDHDGSDESFAVAEGGVTVLAAGINKIGKLLCNGNVVILGTGIMMVDEVEMGADSTLSLQTNTDIYEDGTGSVAFFLKTGEEEYTLANGDIGVTGILDEQYTVKGVKLIVPSQSKLLLNSVGSALNPSTGEVTYYFGGIFEDGAYIPGPGVELTESTSSLTISDGASLYVEDGAEISMLELDSRENDTIWRPSLQTEGTGVLNVDGIVSGEGIVKVLGAAGTLQGSGRIIAQKINVSSSALNGNELTLKANNIHVTGGGTADRLSVANSCVTLFDEVTINNFKNVGTAHVILKKSATFGNMDVSDIVYLCTDKDYGDYGNITGSVIGRISGSGVLCFSTGIYQIAESALRDGVAIDPDGGALVYDYSTSGVTDYSVVPLHASPADITDLAQGDEIPMSIAIIDVEIYSDPDKKQTMAGTNKILDPADYVTAAPVFTSGQKIDLRVIKAYAEMLCQNATDQYGNSITTTSCVVELVKKSGEDILSTTFYINKGDNEIMGEVSSEDVDLIRLMILVERQNGNAGSTATSTNTAYTGTGVLGGSGAGSVKGGQSSLLFKGNPAPQPDPDPQPAPDPQPDPQPDPKPQPNPTPTPDPAPGPNTDTNSKSGTDSGRSDDSGNTSGTRSSTSGWRMIITKDRDFTKDKDFYKDKEYYLVRAYRGAKEITEVSELIQVEIKNWKLPEGWDKDFIFAVFKDVDKDGKEILTAFRAVWDSVTNTLTFKTNRTGHFALVSMPFEFDLELFKKEFYAVLAELDVIKELPLRQDVK